MVTYVNQTEMKSLWKSSLRNMFRECRNSGQIPEGLVELTRHNLYAKYVSYDVAKDLIEIGVNESSRPAVTYPDITVYTFPLQELEQKLQTSYSPKRGDVEFYARIFTGKNLDDRMVVL